MQGTLANDRYITKLLIKISNGDCSKWLEQFLKHWEKMLETTGNGEKEEVVPLFK